MKRKIISLFLAAVMMLGAFIMSIPASAALNFNDTDGHWGKSAIEYVVENGLMNGVGNGESFAPDMSLTRGMVVTVLYRDNGSPKQPFKGKFLDVKDGAYYTAAAEWAYENGIVTGTGTDDWGEPYFSPDRDITRQELATMFKRYADFKHVDTAKGVADIASFPDASSVADWARDAVKWAVGVGLITGKSNGGAATLSPTDKAVRAEFATIIKRFKEADFVYHIAYEAPEVMSHYTELPYPMVDDADIYVAVDGDDKNPGTKDKPLATLEGAKAKVRELRKTAGDEIKVAFKAGNYGKLNNVQFTSEDAGTEKAPVTYCKYGDGDVIFSNGIIIHTDDFTAISDNEKAIFPAESVRLIKKLSLKGLLPGEIGMSNYLFSEVDGLIWLARDLNKNSLGQDVYYSKLVTEASDRKQAIKLLGSLPAKVKGFSNVDGLMFKGMLLTGYTFNRFEAKYFDPETNELFVYTEKDVDLMPDMTEGSLAEHGGFATAGRMDTKIFFYNLPEFMDMQGEYWIDKKTETLYVYNPQGRYTLCTDGTMMTLNEGADHISFIGLEFNGCADTMIYSNADFTTYDRCIFANIGGHYGIRGEGVNHFNFINSDMHNFVDGGLYFISDADRANIIPAGNVVRNNVFYDFGLSEYWSNGLRIKNDVGCIVEHNEFRNGAHGGLRYDGCIDILIQYNVFDRMMQTTQDYGAIYTIWSMTYRDNVIRYNLFKNITGEGAQIGAAAYGFYVDNVTCGTEIYGNIFYNGGIHAVTLHDGRDNYVHDNVIINTVDNLGGDFLMYTKGFSPYVKEDGTVDPDGLSYMYKHWVNALEALPKPGDEGYEIWCERWPLMFNYTDDPARINDIECVYHTVNYINDNYSIGCDFDPGPTYDRFGVGEGNLVFELDENPLFVCPATGDYRLREDADFKEIPYEKIGRY